MHERHMRQAIELARANPEAPFGCVIVDVRTGKILGEGLNDARRSPVLHGETAAIIALFEEHPEVDTSGLALYTTAEPCPMCSGAILWSGIPRVVLGTTMETLKGLGLPQIDITCEEISKRASFGGFEVIRGVFEDECDDLFREMAVRRSG